MGKRELLLIVGFVAIGFIVYQVTAPASQPGEEGFSWSGLVEHVRREIRGNRAHAEVTSQDILPLEEGVAELRFETARARLTVTGEKRDDIAYQFTVRSNGYDEAEARMYAEQTKLQLNRSADSLVVKIEYPRPAVQWTTLVLQVPEHLKVRVQPNGNRLELTDLASVELVEATGETIIRRVAGRVSATHRGGELTVEDVGSLRVNGRGSEVRVSRAAGEAIFQLQAGDLRGTDLAGPIDLEATNTDVQLDGLAASRGPHRVTIVSGSLDLKGLSADARIDARNAEVEVVLDRAAPIAIYSEGPEDLDVTAPPGGFQLDALVTRGRLTVPDDLQHLIASPDHSGEDSSQRASGPVKGGGPLITLRADRGNIILRAPASGAAH